MKKIIVLIVLMVASAMTFADAKYLGKLTYDVGGAYGNEVKASDPDGDTITIEPTSMPEGMTWNAETNWWNWTPSATGTYEATFRVTDSQGAYSEGTFIIEVVQQNRPPVLLSLSEIVAYLMDWLSVIPD